MSCGAAAARTGDFSQTKENLSFTLHISIQKKGQKQTQHRLLRKASTVHNCPCVADMEVQRV
jgi:hypothetical protein